MHCSRFRPHIKFIKLVLILLTIIFNFSVWGQSFTNTLEDSVYAQKWLGIQTIDSGFSHSGTHYSLTDSLHPYGLGLEMYFPEEKQGLNTTIVIEGWVKSNVQNANATFVVSINNNGNQVKWDGIPLAHLITEKDKWFYFSDSINIPANITATGKIKAFLWNVNRKNKIGIDDLKITFLEKKVQSYFPDLKAIDYSKNLGKKQELFKNGYYSVMYNLSTQQIMIYGNKSEIIANNIFYLVEANSRNQKHFINNTFEFKGSKEKREKTTLRFVLKTKINKIKFDLVCESNSSKIDFNVEEKFTKKIDVNRSVIVVDAGQKPTEIYRFNRQLQSDNYQKEYWLDKEGVKFGEADSSLIFYNNLEVSSLQLNTSQNQLLINLDWEKDHPFLRFPLAPDSSDWKIDQSASTNKKGSKRTYFFSAYAGSKTKTLPRFMKNPKGFESTYIWTEHADYSDIRTNRATYFGSEEITNADSAIGGFVKFNIPVTKSVFYDNPDSISNYKASHGLISTLESTIKTDASFKVFLDQINKYGSEICMHTPEQFTTNNSRFEEALNYFQKNYNSISWIDHGYNNKQQNNREDLVCDGSLKKSPFYSIDKWEKYGVKYFWNSYYEDYFTFMEWAFNSSVEKAYTGWGDLIPKPDYWQHISKTKNLYHWPTASALFIKNDGFWNYNFNKLKFDDFISNWSVEINHCYPAWVDPEKGFWKYTSDSTIVAQDGFNNTLKLMSELRDEGKLNVCTVKDFMDYRLLTAQVEYEILTDGRIKISNNTEQNIYGLSFAAIAKYVLVNRLKPQQKIVNGDLIFWFDLKSGESKIIRIVE